MMECGGERVSKRGAQPSYSEIDISRHKKIQGEDLSSELGLVVEACFWF